MWLLKDLIVFTAIISLVYTPVYISAARLDALYCGFKQSCQRNQTDFEERAKSCCRQCECSDVCQERNTCCQDKAGIPDTVDIVKQQCIQAQYIPEGSWSSLNRVQSYYVRGHCPKTFRNPDIKGKCENGSSESFDEMLFVSSADGNIVYKNKFCAICHGEQETVPWTFSVDADCTDFLSTENVTLSTLAPVLFENCLVGMQEPENIERGNVLCFGGSMVEGRCNVTGDWEVYDAYLEEMCLSPPEHVFYHHKTLRRHTVYRNVYCYLCNSKSTVVPETCQIYNQRSTVHRSLAVLIRNDPLARSIEQDKKSSKCNDDQILDSFFNICRRMYCPIFFLPSYGNCEPLFDANIYHPLILKLVPLDPLTKTDPVQKELASRNISVLRKTGFGGCRVCNTFVYTSLVSNETLLTDMYFKFSLKQSERCKLEYLVSRLTSIEMASSSIKLQVNKKSVRFDVFWDDTKFYEEHFFAVLHSRLSDSSCPQVRLERASSCAKVKLTKVEFQRVLDSHDHANELLVAPSKEDEEGTMFVCCDKYIIRQRSLGIRNGPTIAFATMVLLSVCYICWF